MPAFFVSKSALHTPLDQDNNLAAPGEAVAYNIVATNNGNVDLTAVVVEDMMFEGRQYTLPDRRAIHKCSRPF